MGNEKRKSGYRNRDVAKIDIAKEFRAWFPTSGLKEEYKAACCVAWIAAFEVKNNG